jgi:hypothetical protein
MPRFLLYSLGIACFLAGGVLSYLLFSTQGCGQSRFTDNDSLKVALAFSEGQTQGTLKEKVRSDSLLKIIHVQNQAKATKSDRALAAYIPKFEKKDSVLQTASIEDQNAFLKNLLETCDQAARSLADERNGLKLELETAYGRIDIGNTIIDETLLQKAILKNIVKNLEAEVKALSKTSFWKEHKFEIGFIAGAAATTATYLSVK